MRVASTVVLVVGLVLAAFAHHAWKTYSSYTIRVEGTVSKRTPSFCAVTFDEPRQGGHAQSELQYSTLSGSGSDAPPAAGPKFDVGDKVALLHPPGMQSEARLAAGLAPTVPPWVGWVGVGLTVVGACALVISWRRRPAVVRS